MSIVEQLHLPGLENHLLAVLLGTPRLLIMLMVVPFFGGSVVAGMVRFALAVSLYLVLHPALLAGVEGLAAPEAGLPLSVAVLLVKESFLGFVFAWIAGLLFWAVQSAGLFIDQQRGSSQAQEMDPMTGEESSPLGVLFFQSTVYLFFSGGAFLAFMGVVYGSYEVWPALSLLPSGLFDNPALPRYFAAQVVRLMAGMLLLSGPIVAACLLTDISLALINRSAQQLNVYVLAMPIKSGLASVLLIAYFGLLMSKAGDLFVVFIDELGSIFGLIPFG